VRWIACGTRKHHRRLRTVTSTAMECLGQGNKGAYGKVRTPLPRFFRARKAFVVPVNTTPRHDSSQFMTHESTSLKGYHQAGRNRGRRVMAGTWFAGDWGALRVQQVAAEQIGPRHYGRFKGDPRAVLLRRPSHHGPLSEYSDGTKRLCPQRDHSQDMVSLTCWGDVRRGIKTACCLCARERDSRFGRFERANVNAL
jgi:hypothetical protein